jgi:transcriptional/translational regulatory protein YebC/TACO1
MGASGCVSWSFDRRGVIVVDNGDGDLDEDKVFNDAIEAGADDIEADENIYEIYTVPEDFTAVNDALDSAGYAFLSAQIEMVPQSYVKLENPDDIKNMEKMLDLMEDNDDVQNVWHNCSF